MNVDLLKLAYFSPTGTSKAVCEAIAEGLAPVRLESIDATSPKARMRPLSGNENELLALACPVYMGRIPAVFRDWLAVMRIENVPAVCVVVYGNRAYENALLELADAVTQRGGLPVACAAFIGEHSFSHPDRPTAQGRPHAQDLALAREFGRKIAGKLRAAPSVAKTCAASIPGARPYGGVTKLWDVDFIAVGDGCLQCGLCADICPVGAIDPHDAASIDIEKCLTCCACIKRCPQQARTMRPGPVMDASIRLTTLYGEPKRPECFL